MSISPIISIEDFIKLDKRDYVLIDASAGSKNRYDDQHIDGALFIDVDKELAHVGDYAAGGRHPLPTNTQFSAVLAKFGITKNTLVIIYDDKNAGNAAARFWWMLNAIGHDKTQVLNGGFKAALNADLNINNKIELSKAITAYEISDWQWPTVNIDEVELARKDNNKIVVDVRDANRYAGLTEPIDLIAGHIPGAVNIPFTENLDENGLFLSPQQLKLKYNKAFEKVDTKEVIIHCGSGITACHTILALAYAGFEIPKLYVGSWSEWSRNNREMSLLKD